MPNSSTSSDAKPKTSQPPYPLTLNATHSERERRSESKFTTYPTILLYNTPAHTVRMTYRLTPSTGTIVSGSFSKYYD